MLDRIQKRSTAGGSKGCLMGTEVPTPWFGWQRTDSYSTSIPNLRGIFQNRSRNYRTLWAKVQYGNFSGSLAEWSMGAA
jgi:hypothetical protein